MAGGVQDHQIAVRQVTVDVLPDGERRDRILLTLQNERRSRALGRSARLSERNVTAANCLAMSGSVRQKLLVSSAASSGRSGLPMMTGARLLDHPR